VLEAVASQTARDDRELTGARQARNGG
jgi:hypothetical protein